MEEKSGNGTTGKEAYGTDERRIYVIGGSVKDGRGFNARYTELLGHYGMEPSKIAVGKANENGDVEQSHFRFRSAVDQRLRLRGGRDFGSLEEYRGFLKRLAVERNGERAARLKDELQAMRRLPVRRVEAFREEWVTVSRWSTVRVAHNVYSVPSGLIGYRLRARIHAGSIELELWRADHRADGACARQ